MWLGKNNLFCTLFPFVVETFLKEELSQFIFIPTYCFILLKAKSHLYKIP